MSDVLFPAKVTITREVSVHGLPITRAVLDIDDTVRALPLPDGKPGRPGPRGRPRAPWVKAGEVETAADLPTGLGADDRGKWWHDLATDDMWTWTGAEWKQSVEAVGPVGPVAYGSSLTVAETVSDPKLRTAGAEIAGAAGDRELTVVTPAGPRGGPGPVGPSGNVATSDEFDGRIGFVNDSVFAWNRVTRKFRAMPPPGAVGLWSASAAQFPATVLGDFDTINLVAIACDPLPFAWRPRVHAVVGTLVNGEVGFAHVWARLNDWSGPPVGMGLNPFQTLAHRVEVRPYYSAQGGTATSNNYGLPEKLTPSSEVAVVRPYEKATVYFRVERDKGDRASGSQVQFRNDSAFLPYAQVQAIPVSL